jgi:hypothetical protein
MISICFDILGRLVRRVGDTVIAQYNGAHKLRISELNSTPGSSESDQIVERSLICYEFRSDLATKKKETTY